MRLSHLHIPIPISYARSLRLQEAVLERHFAYNTSRLQPKTLSSFSINNPPPATLLTFQTTPTYTVGRRHLKTNPLSDAQIEFLTRNDLASFHASPRGGLLTYHAPGQLTGYLIYNLRHHNITPRCHVRLLEESVIRTAAKYQVKSMTTEDPGVWVQGPNGEVSDRKLCAIGVHVTRGVTSHGIGLNVYDQKVESGHEDLYKLPTSRSGLELMQESSTPAPGYLSWGFSRIIACGLEGKSVTWLGKEGARSSPENLEDVSTVLAHEICHGLSEKGKVGVDGIDKVQESDIFDLSSDETIDSLTGQKVGMQGGLEDWVDMFKGGKMIHDHATKK